MVRTPSNFMTQKNSPIYTFSLYIGKNRIFKLLEKTYEKSILELENA